MDIVTSLGADEEKIILAGSAKGNRFHLQDVSRNTPGSASVGYSSSITYQQVILLSQVFRHRKMDAPTNGQVDFQTTARTLFNANDRPLADAHFMYLFD